MFNPFSFFTQKFVLSIHKPILAILLTICLTSISSAQVKLGIDVLRDNGFQSIRDKRVGLLTHPAGVDSNGKSTIQILHQSSVVNLVALFGPEHGIYGDEKANQPVDNRVDPRTRLPVFSLYGKYRTPTTQMLSKIDVMVVDLQDIGVRSYTYVSCLRLTMEACFRENVEVIVLDRPNPLGGEKVDGPCMDESLRSYVGAFQVPYVHGLTIGEIARIAKINQGWLKITDNERARGKLSIVPMQGWKRSMTWDQTGLKWIPTSPGIPSLSAVLGYAMTGLGAEINGFSHGFGTEYPFRLLSMKGVHVKRLNMELNELGLKGVQFKELTGNYKNGKTIEGAYLQVYNWQQLSPTALSFYMMPLACRLQDKNPYATASSNKALLFNKHVGSNTWWQEISTKGKRANAQKFLNHWKAKSDQFKIWSSKYWIYE